MKQKIFTLLLAVAVSIGTMFATVHERVQIGSLYYNLNDKNFQAEVTSKNDVLGGYSSSLTITSASIPSSVSYSGKTYNVVAIGGTAFSGCTRLTSVTIPSSVTSIGIGAFADCSGLTSVTIPNSVTSIGTAAFEYCTSLVTITIPNSVTRIGGSAFEGCSSLTSVTIPNSVSKMGTGVFEGCSSLPIENNIRYAGSYLVEAVNKTLSSYTIKSGTRWIGSSAFRNCSNLNSITIPSSVKVIQSSAFKDCTGLISVTIPNSVTDIGDEAFHDCISLSSVTIPNSITTINAMTFRGCIGLTSVTIPNSVTSIGDWAFADCTGLISVEIPNSVTSIESGAFKWVRNIVYTGSSAWSPFGALSLNGFVDGYMVYKDATKTELLGCSSTVNGEVIIPNSVTNIGNNAFYGCNGMTSVTIPNSITSIGQNAFYSCTGLTTMTIPNSVTSIGSEAFIGCGGLTSVVWNAKNCADFASNKTPFYSNYNDVWGQYIGFDLRSQITSFTLGDEVEHIPANLCNGMVNLASVTIPESVTIIGENAFSGCNNIKNVTLNSNAVASKNYDSSANLTTIFGTQVREYIIGEAVTAIGIYAFYNSSSLQNITMPSSLISLGQSAFSYCTGLTSITIPNSVTSIGQSAFSNCSINTINFMGTLEDWLNKEWSPSSISDNYRLLLNDVLQKNIIIPNSVTSIGNNAFNGCSGLTSIEIPNSVTSIGNNAFQSCTGLTSVTIPNSVTSIGQNAFYSCTGLTSVVWNAKNCSNSGNFGSQVTSFTFGDEVEVIPPSACSGMTNLTSITIPNSVTSIGSSAFQGCNGLISVTIGNSVTSIGSSAFQGCTGLTSVTIGNSVTSIGSSAFQGCNGLTSVTIGNSVTNIGAGAFNDCSRLTSLALPNSITTIGQNAFSGCTGLTSITIPENLVSLGSGAFTDCNNLTEVTLNSNAIVNGTYSIWNSISSLFGSQVTKYIIGDNVLAIGSSAFYKCNVLTSIEIPNSVTSIGSSAFCECTGLTSVIIPNSVTSIGSSAFHGCNGLTSVTIGNSVTSIGSSAFQGCTGLTSITIPNSVTSIGNNAFQSCTGLTSVTIPNSVTRIESGAFENCTGLTSIEIPNSVTSIGGSAFSGCSGLTSVTIPNSVTSIESEAFENCTGLTSIEIPNSVTSIAGGTFAGCTGLISVTIPNSVTSIGGFAFAECTGLTSVTCLAPTPPTRDGGVFRCFYGVNCSNIPLYVPMESVSLYQAANDWKEFNVIGIMLADEVETAVFSATPTDDFGVILEWQAVENAILYNIDIIQGNDTIRKLQFDSNGKLINSPSNAPSRYPNIRYTSTAVHSGNGWRYELNDLDPGTNYTYSITVKAENGSVLYTQSIGFTTKAETFIIKFVNWNGEELLVLPGVVKGTTPSYTGETPVRPNTAEYTYTFAGWDPAIVAVTGDATYTATFSSVVNVYTSTVNAVNGQGLGGGEYQYGTTTDLTAIPDEGYVFDQWSDGVTDNPRTITVTGDVEYIALFKSAEGLENIYTSEPVQKVIIDQKVYILRGEKIYTLQGQEVK